jgi:hypothetical protein
VLKAEAVAIFGTGLFRRGRNHVSVVTGRARLAANGFHMSEVWRAPRSQAGVHSLLQPGSVVRWLAGCF